MCRLCRGLASLALERRPGKAGCGAPRVTQRSTRTKCEQLRQSHGQSCVVENKPGEFGIIAIEEMARARPDGYTLQIGNVSTNAITPVLFKSKFTIDYEKDVVALARLADLPSDGHSPKLSAQNPPRSPRPFPLPAPPLSTPNP